MSKPRPTTAQPPLFNELALRAMGVPTADRTCAPSGHVVIGFVDYGFDLLHPCLLDASGTKSRFKYLWDQNRAPELARQPQLPLAAIEDYSTAHINQLVASAQAQRGRASLDRIYDPYANYYGRVGVTNGAHGTLMASIAAGTAFDGFRSPAPYADLIGVQLAVADTDWREETAAGEPAWRRQTPTDGSAVWAGWRSYDACPQIVHAIRYIYDRAQRLDADLVIINLSIGTWAGAHDGRSRVEQAIAKVIADGRRPGGTPCQVVVGAGNSGADRGHFTATFKPGDATSFQWVMHHKDCTQNKLEVWYDGAPLEVRLTGPGGQDCPVLISPDATHTITLGGVQVGLADHVIGTRGPLSRVRILLHPPYMAAINNDADGLLRWSLALESAVGTTETCTLHAWVERDDGITERSWLEPHHRDSTLCCLATAPGAVVVAGGHHRTTDGALTVLPFSGRGPAPWSAHASPPTLAPAYNIWGAHSKTTGFVETSGTSAAAALMSGVLAARHLDADQEVDADRRAEPTSPLIRRQINDLATLEP